MTLKVDSIYLKPLPTGKKIFFASDFHLGTPDSVTSLDREQKIVRWLESIQEEVHALFLLGDIFDFWIEYKYVVPKGFIRLQGKLAEFSDLSIPVFLFCGNHDLWMHDYFPKELNIPVSKGIASFTIAGKKFLVGHGDDLGASKKYSMIKKFIYTNLVCQWAFRKLPPNLGIAFAHYLSRRRRVKTFATKPLSQEDDRIFNFCKQTIEPRLHHDFYIFGHMHFPLAFRMHEKSFYYNLGDWVTHFTYGVFNGQEFRLATFE